MTSEVDHTVRSCGNRLQAEGRRGKRPRLTREKDTLTLRPKRRRPKHQRPKRSARWHAPRLGRSADQPDEHASQKEESRYFCPESTAYRAPVRHV